MKILIIDDDENLTDALREILAAKTLDADCAATASEAVDMLEKKDYDLVLLDFALPTHDGIWFMNNAKIPRQTKVLLMTGHLNRDIINTMFDLGACGYMIKPFDEDELMHNLDFFLSNRVNASQDNTDAGH